MRQHLKKKPIQIYIEYRQDDILGLISKSRGVSKTAIIRETLDKFLENLPPEKDPAMSLMNLGRSTKRDLAEKHDKYLAKYNINKQK